MGLAASQARLLTITSRLSSVELRQQRIAMDKMRLANDTDNVSQEYTTALNNQVLKLNNKDFTYADLTAAGYSIMKASSGVVAVSGKYTGNIVGMPTCPRPEEIERPAILDIVTSNNNQVYSSIPSHVSTDYGFNGVNHEMKNDYDYLMTALNMVRDTFVSKTDGTVSNINKNYDYEKTTQKRYELWNEMGKPMIDNLVSKLQSSNPTVAEAIKKKGESITNSLYSLANKTGTNANRSAMNIYKSTNATITAVSNSLFDSGILTQLESSTLASDEYNQNGKKIPTSKTTTTTNERTAEQEVAYNQWQKDIQEAKDAWTAYDNYVSARATAEGATDEQIQLYDQLVSSPQFLNQGLLNGYLTLIDSSGNQVSTTSDTKFTTEYDKSDDAAAEAKYNAEIAKINKKEKMLDMESKRIETEYSALTTEYESIKSIISTHASKDFQYFS